MDRLPRTRFAAVISAAGLLTALVLPLAGPAQAAPSAAVDPALPTSPELSETSRLADRRFVVTGDQAWALGTADGRYPAAGFHTRGEMGGFWLPNLKLLDGMWFGIDNAWIGAGTKTTTGWGYVRTDLPDTNGVSASRTDFVPDGVSGALVGLTLRSATTKNIVLRADAHSELLGSYPWGETTPSQTTENLRDTVARQGRDLVFRDRGKPPHPNAEAHDWAAAVGSSLEPTNARTGQNFRGPQDPAVICPASGPDAPTQPPRCDDTAYGRGVGGQLSYSLRLRAGEVRTIWFGVGGSTTGPAAARAELRSALRDPAGALQEKLRTRNRIDRRTQVELPGDERLAASIRWSKQMLAASEQRVSDARLRVVEAGKAYPAPVGTVDLRWFGAGWPDYTWLFGTDGEYTAYAAVAAGQFAPIKAHLRALRDVSEIVNKGSGKIVHEVTPDGAVFFGANADAGNTDESSKYPSAVNLVWKWTGDRRFLNDLYPASVKAMRYIDRELDADRDGWPEGLGNVERAGMGEEKLDNAVYTIRGYADLADMAQVRGDRATQRWATDKALRMLAAFERAWWYGGDTRSYADSLDDPGNVKVFQRHWIGLTPTDAVLPRLAGRPAGPLAAVNRANATLDEHEQSCYTGGLGLFHTGTGPTSAPAGNPGDSCDSVLSEVPSERNIFTLNSAIAAVSEGNYGRLGTNQQGVYTGGNADSQLDPAIWEMPGMMPEIVPSPDNGANIDRLLTERSMVMQAWGAYGTIWPVVHQWLGVSPDLGRGRVAVVPQIPAGQTRASGTDIRLGDGSIDVAAQRNGKRYTTRVVRDGRVALTIGAVVSTRAVASATLDGRRVTPSVVRTARGWEATVAVRPGQGTSTLVLTLR